MKTYMLPSVTSRDIVTEIAIRKQIARAKRIRTRCTGSNSCDCPRCR